MKKLVLLTLVSLPTFACPNLAGKYFVCKSTTGQSSGSRDVVVAQKVANGITTFTMTSTDEDTQERETINLIADGKLRKRVVKDPQTGLELREDTKGACQGATLIIDVAAYVNNQLIGKTNSKVTKTGKVMKNVTTGEFDGQRFQDTILCQ